MKYFLALCFFLATAFEAYSQQIQCNKQQTYCEIAKRDLSIGDSIVIMSDDDELVARGLVKGIDGVKRKITITEKYLTIQSDHTILPIDPENEKAVGKLTVPRNIAKKLVGAELSIGSLNIGSGVQMLGVKGFGIMRNELGFEYVARAGLLTLDGKVTRSYDDRPSKTSPFVGTLFTVAAGAGQTFFRRKVVSLHVDAVLGFGYLSASVDGNAGDVDGGGYTTRVKNGIAVYLEGNAEAHYFFRKEWLAVLGLSAGYYPNALGTSILAGIGYQL